MSGLRVRQRLEREKRILSAARDCFLKYGYSLTTIEMIAEKAEVSAVTVYNYYRTKDGALLSIIIEGDRVLVDLLNNLVLEIINKPLDEAVYEFCMAILDHALLRLDRNTWRHVIAASMTENEVEFGKHYHALDQELVRVLAQMISSSVSEENLHADIIAETAARVLYDSYNSHFHRFISLPDLSIEDMRSTVHLDIDFIIGRLPI